VDAREHPTQPHVRLKPYPCHSSCMGGADVHMSRWHAVGVSSAQPPVLRDRCAFVLLYLSEQSADDVQAVALHTASRILAECPQVTTRERERHRR
jgi:hypothetical protein